MRLILLFLMCTNLMGASPASEDRLTVLGLYVSAAEAGAWLNADPEGVTLIDIRTAGEFVFVGHPLMALNIPFMLQEDRWDDEKGRQAMTPNPEFLGAMEARFAKDATLLLMCRSGKRSAAAVDMLAKAGYRKCYTVTDGFEGDKLKDGSSPENGHRVVDGWKNSALPWGYALDPKQLWLKP